MRYYIALVWNPADGAAREEARALLQRFQLHGAAWRIAVDVDGLAFLVSHADERDLDALLLLPDGGGVVFGSLFERAYVDHADTRSALPNAVVLDERRARSIVASRGLVLLSEYWGAYVAFLRDSQRQMTCVVRDPTGVIPCQSARIGRVQAYFVRLEDCERLGLRPRAVNWRYLLGYLTYDSVCVRETALEGVETVLAGECVEHVGDDRNSSFHWNPLQIAKCGVIENAAEAVEHVGRTVRACVHAWASRHESILLDLSGGLDSSILLACLVSAPSRPRVVCRHNYGSSGDFDERAFARLAARRVGVPLLEQQVTANFDLPPPENARRCVSPFPQLVDEDAQRAHIQLLRNERLSAHFTGDGGDEIFHRGGPLPSAVDYAWRHPFGGRSLALTIDDAVYSRRSFWRTARAVARYGLLRRRWSLRDLIGTGGSSLLSDEIRHEAARDETLWHPLYRGQPDLEPGKLVQAYHLTFGAGRGFVPSGPTEPAPYVTPLMSQPLMELALRIPVYVLMNGGRDRAVARAAFAAELPPGILRRRGKGCSGELTHDVLWRNIALVRELLLDGYLAANGFLSRSRLQEALSGDPTRLAMNVMELASCLDVEIWVRSRSCAPARAAA